MEIEAKFLEIDVPQIQKKLKDLGARKKFDTVFREAIFQAAGERQKEWEKTFKRVRVRDQGDKVFLTLKALPEKKFKIDTTHEVEIEVSSFEKAVEFLIDCDLMQIREQEKRRIHYELDNVAIDIDYWPQLPPYLEIEADSEKEVKVTAKKLGLDFKKAVFVDARQVYKRYYNIDVMKMKGLKF